VFHVVPPEDGVLEREGGPATLDVSGPALPGSKEAAKRGKEGLTSAEVKRLLGNLIDRNLAPNTIHGFFEDLRAFANWALREGFPVDPAVVRMRPPKVPETELETYNPTQQEAMLAAAAPGWPGLNIARNQGQVVVVRMASICPTASLMPFSVPAPGTSPSGVGANLQVIVMVVFSGVSTSRTLMDVVGGSSFGPLSSAFPSSNAIESGGSTEMIRHHAWSFSPSGPVM
jgi:hypothetical protein